MFLFVSCEYFERYDPWGHSFHACVRKAEQRLADALRYLRGLVRSADGLTKPPRWQGVRRRVGSTVKVDLLKLIR
jgi:hypothetical protein